MMLTVLDANDGSFLMQQKALAADDQDVVLRFGPLTSPMSALFADDWGLSIWGFRIRHDQGYAIRLHKGARAYTVGKSTPRAVAAAKSLVPFVSQREHGVQEIKIQADPLLALMMQYPRAKQSPFLIGNQSARQAILAELTHESMM
jgi:hypothetical protein